VNLSQRAKYLLTVTLASAPSFGGIIYGAYANPAYGDRGGAITVALSFLILFLRRNHGYYAQQEIYKSYGLDKAPPLEIQIEAISARLNVNDDGQAKQNKALAWTSCIGTIAWGFGDFASAWLRNFVT
jgi:hypothetical protein